MHTHTISELQKVNFTVTDFNSILFLRLLHIVPARLTADSCSVRDKLKYWNSSWWIKRHAARMPSRIEPDWFVCLWFQVGCDPLEESADMLREAVLCVLWVVTLGLLSCCWSLWNAARNRRIQTWCNSDTQCSWNAGALVSPSIYSVMKTLVEVTDNIKMIILQSCQWFPMCH